eukprot:GFYU01044164.1.p1 GENE.GFYU01044164.1~~GFYU01044164.1.p1  ORF type:complete len:109 (-),score=19.99 GFYU01044164.1:216-542(-)
MRMYLYVTIHSCPQFDLLQGTPLADTVEGWIYKKMEVLDDGLKSLMDAVPQRYPPDMVRPEDRDRLIRCVVGVVVWVYVEMCACVNYTLMVISHCVYLTTERVYCVVR